MKHGEFRRVRQEHCRGYRLETEHTAEPKVAGRKRQDREPDARAGKFILLMLMVGATGYVFCVLFDSPPRPAPTGDSSFRSRLREIKEMRVTPEERKKGLARSERLRQATQSDDPAIRAKEINDYNRAIRGGFDELWPLDKEDISGESSHPPGGHAKRGLVDPAEKTNSATSTYPSNSK